MDNILQALISRNNLTNIAQVSSKIARTPLQTGSPPMPQSPPSSAPALVIFLSVASSAPKARVLILAGRTPTCEAKTARVASGSPRAHTVSTLTKAKKKRKRRKRRQQKGTLSTEGEKRSNLRRHR